MLFRSTLIASIGPEVSYEALLEKMGISSHTTRNFAFRLGSSKQYGLVTADGHTILLTDLAKEVLAQAEPSRSVLLLSLIHIWKRAPLPPHIRTRSNW